MVNKHMKQHTTSLIIGEMQIQITVNTTSHSLGWLLPKIIITYSNWNPHALLVVMENGAATMETAF